MTREEAKEILNNNIVDGHVEGTPRFMDAFWMAVDALELLTSYEQTINKLTKAISRQKPCKGSETKQIVNHDSDLLIVKYPFLLSEEEADYFYKRTLSQKAKGLVILPAGCEAVYIPNDCEVVIETEGEKA